MPLSFVLCDKLVMFQMWRTDTTVDPAHRGLFSQEVRIPARREETHTDENSCEQAAAARSARTILS